MRRIATATAAAVAAAAVAAARRERSARLALAAAQEQMRAAWRREREANRELRTELHLRAEGRSALAGDDDVRALVLRAAVRLVGASKGLLLSRSDADADGDLDLVCAQGFQHDPEHSAIVQHFTRLVLTRDEIVRRDHPIVPGATQTPADEEIESIVATPLYLHDRFAGVVLCANRPGGFEEVQDEILLALGDHAGLALHQGRLRDEIREGHRGVVRVLVELLAAHDPERHRESATLAVRATTLAADLGFDERERDALVCATLLRGIGELALPDDLLAEPGPFSAEQRDAVELHPRIGFNVVGRLTALRDVARTILYHHERWDGEGYPAGLSDERIPRTARALAVLEAFSAITHDRPHRVARSPEDACDELLAQAGRQFDPEAARALVDELRHGRSAPPDHLAEPVLEALPLDPAVSAGGGGVLGPLAAAATDGLTLLGTGRALQQDLRDAVGDARDGRPFAVVVLLLDDLPRINERDGLAAGDRLVQSAARAAQRVAARSGGTAYRAGGRRLAVLAPLSSTVDALLDDVATEFAEGPAVRAGAAAWRPGDSVEAVLTRARDAAAAARV